MFDLSGKTALVTGASGGLGSAIVEALVGQGARVAVSGSNEAKLNAFAQGLGDQAVPLVCNLSNPEEVDQSALLVAWLKLAYASLIPQVIALVLALGFTNRLAELRTVMLAAIAAGTVTVILSSLFPAVGNYVHLALSANDFSHVDPFAGDVHLRDFAALRDGTAETMVLGKMEGIITFPSYHAALSVVTLWGFWASRIAWVRWPGMLLAASTIVATPVDGGHYLVDVLAGGAIAVAALVWSKRAISWSPAPMASPFRRSREASAR